MMVETFVEHSRYISLFSETVEEEEQACIYSLSYQKTIDTVKTLSKQDPEKCPAVESICHYANTVLSENNGHLSTWLVARLIKYLIYRVKTKYVGRLKVEADLDCKINEESSSRSTIEPRRAYSSKTEYVFNGKANIRSRASNVSFDGPNLYVVLSGFHNPDLPAELLSVGVPLTCILEIKLPGEKYIGHRKTKGNDIRAKTPFFEDHHINEIKLVEFWRVTHKRFANLSAYPMYSNITILTIDLPVYPETVNAIEKESLRRDIYDRILFTFYHLYELYRQHAKYLKNMKLEKRIFDKRDEVVDTKIYDDILKNIPNEYIGAPLILSAILLQVEHNLATSSDGCFLADHDTGFSDADTRHENTSTTAERSPTFNMLAKLKLLDLEYELIDEYDTSADSASQSLQSSDLDVIPYGDTLNVIIRHFHDRRATHLDNAVLRVLWDPRIINIWLNHEVPTRSKSDMYFCHLDNIARAFNQEQKISREEVVHYLYFLMFDDLIFSGSSREARAQLVQQPRDELSELKHMRSTIKRACSVPNFTSPPTTASGLRRCKSDIEIDYCKPVVAFTECSLLFTLTDARETLLPGYLCKNVFKKRSYQRPSLEEYEDVELLSSRVFLQVVHECFQSFDRFVARYFKPTDSLLLYFSNNDAVNNVSEERCLSSICTPIGLHEFCEYIKQNESTADNESKWADGRVMSGKTSMTKKKSDTKIDDVDTFFLPMKKILSSQCYETGGSYDFVGYDLGSIRVQVIHHSKKFLLDADTSVRIELEDWLHGDRNLRIAVTLGIVLGFYRNRRELFYKFENSSDFHWQNFTFDFRASWPSGLLIKPTIGDGTKNPFYIRQSYVSKRPGCAGAVREVCRNFLRNGTVLKYLADNTVIIFRSNGVIVTCMDFDKPQSRDESIHETDPKTEFRIRKGNSRQSVAAKHSGKVINSTETRFNGSMLDAQPSKHIPSSKGDDSLITGAFAVGEVLRYSVVNYDGRCYEVLNDLVVSEHDRFLVRTTLDYEVNEVFTHRADGTDTLLHSNGELVVTFPGYRSWTVSILLIFRMEHKDYATVSYDQSVVSCTLLMPDNLHINILRRGHYEVSMQDQVNLKIFNNDAVFWKICATCGGRSMSTSQTILTTVGILGDMLEVKSDGTTRYHRNEDHQKGRECNDDGLEYGEEKRNSEEKGANLEARIYCKHERYCEMLKFPARSQYRIFAMNRDLTACEYLHRSVRREQELAAVFGDEMSTIQYPISRRPELRRLIIFVPVEPELGSKEMFYKYRAVTSDKRTDYDRIELPRSTYSFPYNWLFPFGKKVVSERTRNEVLAKRNEQSLPKLLRVRVFFGIKGADRSVLIDMQRAMGRYWISDFSFHNIADLRYFLMKNHVDELISRKSYSCVSREKEDKLIDRNKENC
ncbi:hypothetical protein ALC57_15610 [Trachymyrmex cornetzi]|uniref:Uncharacterized protein n=1 Tax=Trachymyrmex cornetzi TaxID=471704 RepID=A0A151IWQ8_9HYME|nr:hypothetical protein ALC57_15610 [Trachymyrmex cornetzi]